MSYKNILLLLVCLSAACSEKTDPSSNPSAETEDRNLPASFLDEAPPPPTSSTVVLSGGNWILGEVVTDTAIVLQNGKLIGWGKRGEIEMPNDSVGKDMRGKWLTPGTTADLEAGLLPKLAAPTPIEPANILIFNTAPDFSSFNTENLYAVIVEGELLIFDPQSG